MSLRADLLDGLPVSVPSAADRFGFDVGIALKGLAYSASSGFLEFSSIRELSPGVLWVVDISQSAFFVKIPAGRGFVHRNFFGEPLSVIAERYCLDLDSPQSLRQAISVLAGVFSRTLIAADNMVHLERLPLEMVPPTLSQWVQRSLLDFDGYESSQLVGDLFLRDIIKTSVNMPAVSAPNQNTEETAHSFYLATPRLDMIDGVFGLRVPCGPWSDLPLEPLGSDTRSKINSILALDRPVLAQVVIHSPSKILSKITQDGLRSGSKRWVTDIDLVFLYQVAAISLVQARVCERYVSLGSTLLQPTRPLMALERSGLSYHLASNAIIHALSTSASNNSTYFATSRMAWVASYLRSKVLDMFLDSELPVHGTLESYDVSSLIWKPENPERGVFNTTLVAISGFEVCKQSPNQDIHVYR